MLHAEAGSHGRFGVTKRAGQSLLPSPVSLSAQIPHQEGDGVAGSDNSRMSLAEVKSHTDTERCLCPPAPAAPLPASVPKGQFSKALVVF